MKRNCLIFLVIWTVVIIFIGRSLLWYFHQQITIQPSTWLPSNNERTHLEPIRSLTHPNPLLKYCNLPTENSFFSHEGVFDSDYKLLGVITIFRHGDRGPLTVINDKREINCSIFVTDHFQNFENTVSKYKTESLQLKLLPKSDFCKPGLLSKQGSSQLIELGYGLKNSYAKHFNFSASNITDRILAYSTPYSRTVQSLYSMLFGLVGSTSFLKISPGRADVSFCFKHCRCEAANRYEKQHKKELYEKLKNVGTKLGNFSEQFRSVLKEIGKSEKDVLLPSTLKDIMLYYVCHNATPYYCHSNRDCMTENFTGPLHEFLQHEADTSASGLNLKKASILRAYGLINNIDQQIQAWISMHKKRHLTNSSESYPPRFTFYSGHDLTLMYLLSSLSVYDGFLPNYASRFTIEVLSKKEGQFYVRLLWNGADITYLVCQQHYCSARFLSKLQRNYLQRHFQTSNFMEACEI